jgi:hypothetical protein
MKFYHPGQSLGFSLQLHLGRKKNFQPRGTELRTCSKFLTAEKMRKEEIPYFQENLASFEPRAEMKKVF